MVIMSQETGGEMYNTLEGWNYGDDYTHNSQDGGAMSVLQEDVQTVLGLLAVVKSMLDDACDRRSTNTGRTAFEHIGQQCTHL